MANKQVEGIHTHQPTPRIIMQKPHQAADLQIIQTTDIIDFVPLLKELEFGDKFSLAMLKWCGIGKRDPLLTFWQVYLAQLNTETIGVMGLYQILDSPPGIVWIGWFGLRPQFRRQGWGKMMINQLKDYARTLRFQQLWVYTDNVNLAAISFYENSGFVHLGTAAEICPGATENLTNIVLKSNLASICE